MPLSCSRIARQAALPTINGISQGSRNSARSTPLSGKFLWKNNASSMPMTNWPTIEPMVNRAVLIKRLAEQSSVTTVDVVLQADPGRLAGEERPERVLLEAHHQVLDHRVAEQRTMARAAGTTKRILAISSRRRPALRGPARGGWRRAGRRATAIGQVVRSDMEAAPSAR